MPDSCLGCRKNKHNECEHRINDGAFDAEDFVPVNCNCPCLGDVPEGGKLIDLVESLRREVKRLQEVRDEGRSKYAKVKNAESHITLMLQEFFDTYYDDEGSLLSIAPSRRWEKGLEILRDKFYEHTEFLEDENGE